MPDWMKYNGVKKTAVASEKPGREARRREWGEDEYSPQWRGECCRGCPWWSGTMCLDDVNEFVHCAGYGKYFREYRIDANGRCRECAAGRVAPHGTENREQKTERAAAKPQTFHGYRERPIRGDGETKSPKPSPEGHGVHLFDW